MPHTLTAAHPSTERTADGAALLAGAMHQLSPLERVVLGLYYREGFAASEIAIILELRASDVEMIHADALARLREVAVAELPRAA